MTLAENIETIIPDTVDKDGDSVLYNAKQEIFLQFARFNIAVEAKGFFFVDHNFLAAVCLPCFSRLNNIEQIS